VDPITTAIVAALPALASDIVSSAVKDAYAGLKSLIARKCGAASAVAKSVDDLEANPKSKGQAMVLSEHVTQANAPADAEIMAAVHKLVEALKANAAPPNVHVEATMTGGVAGVVGAQNVSIGSLKVGAPKTRDKG
jgi:hypothetical protein